MEANTAKRRKLGHSGGLPSANLTSASMKATDEFLDDAKLDKIDGVDEALRGLKETIEESLEPHDPLPIGDVSSKFEKTNRITIPYPDPRPEKNSNYKLSLAKPAQVNVVGSYQLKTMVKSSTEHGIDMIVVMPAVLFQEKDYLNRRYFYKRSYYLACITAGIKKSFSSSMDLVYEDLHGDNLLPILVVRPKEISAKGKYAIRIIPCLPEDGGFSQAKLLPTCNAVRQGTTTEFKESLRPTPFYNSTLKAESSFTPYLRLLNKTAKSCPSYKDACVLGRIWLHKRGFGGNIADGGFGHWELAALMALLLQGGGSRGEAILSSSLSSSQLFRATIQFLSGRNFQKKPLVVGPPPPNHEVIRQKGPVVYDSARELNILWKMTPWSADFLQEQAKWSVEGLRDNSFDQFESLFIVKVDQPLHTFDLLVRVDLPTETEFSDLANHRGVAWDFSEKLHQILNEALVKQDRAELVHLSLPKFSGRSISSIPSKAEPSSTLVGIVLKASEASRKMDHGPSVEEKEKAAKFREFWGEDKAELRRFADGSILECLEWDANSSASIPEQVIKYITKRHLKIDNNSLRVYGDGFAKIAHIKSSDMQIFTAAKKAFEIFEKDVRVLEGLPLHIRQVAGTCPELRYASSYPPLTGKGPTLPMDVVVSFEASGKWADNLVAIQRLKIAFLLKIGSSLEESKDSTKIHLGLDNAETETQDVAFLDVVYETGFAFRLRVQSDAEENELERQARDKTRERRDQIEASELLALAKRTYALGPKHNQTISTWCTRFPPLSASIRLVKHWFSCHKLDSHFHEEIIELFVLQAFLHPWPWQRPHSSATGFLRTMHLLSRWEWYEEPLIVDTSDPAHPMSASERSAIFTRYNECRKQDPRLNRTVLFVATPHDPSGIAYTRDGPSRVVANQMTKLASSACDLVKANCVNFDVRSLFQSSLRHYDVVIRLNPKIIKAVMRDDGTKHSHFKNLDERTGKVALPMFEHPIKAFVRQLSTVYSAALVFFIGRDEENVITAIWNQEVSCHTRTSRVNMSCCFKPSKNSDTDLELNRQAILAEIARIGAGIIEKIEVKGED